MTDTTDDRDRRAAPGSSATTRPRSSRAGRRAGRSSACTRRTSTTTSRPKYYLLTMYPYPSGDLHIGHWYIVTPTDALARFRRMHGYNVFFPIGFDAFGLPAENAAIKNGVHPFDLDDAEHREHAPPVPDDGRDVRLGAPRSSPADPTYYRWNQWLFLRFLEAGPGLSRDVAGRLVPQRRDAGPRAGRGRRPPLLALRRAGREARPGAVVPAHDRSTPTSCSTSTASTGRSRSASSRRTGSAGPRAPRSSSRPRPTTTSRAATSCASSRPGRTRCSGRRSWSSPRSTRWSTTLTAPGPAGRGRGLRRAGPPARPRSSACRPTARRPASPLGADAINPVNGERIPIWIADYVLSGYGTGAIMAVPAHDERDFAFADASSACRSGGSSPRPASAADAPMDGAYIAHAADERLVNSGRVRRAARPTRAARRSSPSWPRPAAPSPRSPTACATG